MADLYEGFGAGLTSPAIRHYTITPGADDLPFKPRAIRCSVQGTATIVDDAGTSITYTLFAGEVLPIRAVKVTAATAVLVAWY
jgi:hypothetical protein